MRRNVKQAERKKERPEQCEANGKKERPANKRVGTLKKKKKDGARAVRFEIRGQWEWPAREALHEREKRND